MYYSKNFIFTSESVSEGHPDKIADQLSDTILDAYISQDKTAKVACECLVTTNYLLIAGEINSKINIDEDTIRQLARETIKNIGYNQPNIGFDADSIKIDIRLHQQSTDIAQGVEGSGLYKEKGAGDQGMMFGFAIDETDNLMPMPISYAHGILQYLKELRHNNKVPFLLPDAKSQVSIHYENGIPKEIGSIVVSSQHTEDVSYETVEEFIIEQCIKQCLPHTLLSNTKYFINPTGKFTIGGPHGDCGLTGRKIIVDTYGGYGRHGGGAFSGKDPSKVDRSVAYMARYIAKNIVASSIARSCEIQLAYAIGKAQPVSLLVNTFNSSKIPDHKIEQIIWDNFDLTPEGIRKTLKLNSIPYLPTATYGHFGRKEESFTWEKLDKTNIFQ